MKQRSSLLGVAAALLVATAVSGAGYAQTGTLFVEGPAVGIGTPMPQQALHVFGDSDVRFLVENINSTTKGRIMMELQNNGGVNFIMVDTAGDNWQFLAETFTATPGFSITRQGSGVRELRVDPSGNLFTSGAVNPPSSKGVKEDLTELDGGNLLDKLERLPIMAWTYSSDSSQAQHVGPFSEDFHALFGLGSDAHHISLGDAAGIALAAAQELYRQSKRKDQRLAELEIQVQQLEALVQRLLVKQPDRGKADQPQSNLD